MIKKEKFAIRSEEIQALIEAPPRWIIRYGLLVIFFILSLLFIASLIIKTPVYIDVSGKIDILGDKNYVKANSNGNITKIHYAGDNVKQGDKLFTLNSDLVTSPDDGYTLLKEPIYVGKKIMKSDTIMYVINENSELLIILNIPEIQFKKVKLGQQVLINFDEKIIQSEISSLGNITRNGVYNGVAIMSLKESEFEKGEISALLSLNQVKILVEQSSLFARLFVNS